MLSVMCLFLSTMFSVFRSGAAVQLENLALQHQIGVLQRSAKKRPGVDRGGPCLLGVWLSGAWTDWGSALAIIQPDTASAWDRKGFSVVLDLEGPARTNRKARRLARQSLDKITGFA